MIKIIIIFILASSAAVFSAPRGEQVVLSSYTTSISDQDEAVKKNISIACLRLNGSVISPGAVFSFNEIVGEGSTANGYLNGRVLYRDDVRMEPGGGLCQVSSTLFNALLLSGGDIVERHRHFKPVSYVPPGLDATIKYGKKDLRMKNSSGRPLTIMTSINDKSLTVEIMAPGETPFKYEITTEEEDLPLPLEDDRERIRQGFSVHVYRKKFFGARLVETRLLYKDYYPPVRNGLKDPMPADRGVCVR
ncbi:MAG: VanW family protein [Spirochaetes bacterium]|jgi:vancomycin resistance protein YoaR|nr:VanW family protein [Spirochaetota bacterium]